MNLNLALRSNPNESPATSQRDSILGRQLQVALHRLNCDVLLRNQVEHISVRFDFQRALARNQTHPFLLGQQRNTFVSVRK